MRDDAALSRQLTSAIRGIEGVSGVYPAQPILEAAAEAAAVKLALRMPDTLVDIDRAEGFTTFVAHIATTPDVPAPDTLRRVAEFILANLTTDESAPGDIAINVTVRLIEDAR